MYQDGTIDEMEDHTMDFWIQLSLTFVAVTAAIFVLFMPKIRDLLSPFIGSGYVALFIRALMGGLVSIIPTVLFI